MSLNKLNQKQVIGDSSYTFETLKTQLTEIESRTRIPAKLMYNTYTQWDGGEENTNTDYITQLDKITIAEGQSSATFVSYIIDTGGSSNVKFNNLEIVETSGAENGSTQYETRTADTEEAIATATWSVLGTDKKIASANGRYIQFRITMTKATYSPVVTSVTIVLYGAAATQEVYDSRGGYKTLALRLDLMNDMARIEYVATQSQTTFALPSGYIATGSGLKIFVYVGGLLQKYGSNDAYTFSENGTSVVFTEGLVEGDVVTIIAYKSGTSSVSESLDTLLALKANLDSPTFTGTVGGITKSMVGLGNVDNTSDLDKPISNATSTAISTEVSSRISADNVLTNNLSTEVSNRESAISTETSSRISVDTALSTAISTEISLRASVDTEVSTTLSTEVLNRESADNVLTNNLSTEISNRISADATIDLQKVYDQSSNGTVTLSTNKVFKILDNDNAIYFQCDPAETNATYVSMTGPVEVSGDMVISGKLTVSGTSTIINSEITDSDHMLLSPMSGSTTAFMIKPDSGVTLTNPIVDLYTSYAGSSVFNINSAGNTTIGGNLTIGADKTIDMGANKITNIAAGTLPTDAVNYGQLSGMKRVISGSETFVGNKQIETATVTVTTVESGSIDVIVTADGMTNSPITVQVITTASESAATVAANIRTALGNNSDITNFFTISGSDNLVVLTAKDFADIVATGTMNINIVGGYGVNEAPTSVNSMTAKTITFETPMSDTTYTVCVIPTSIPTIPASMGEIYVTKTTTGITVTNTGSGTPTFDYTIFY